MLFRSSKDSLHLILVSLQPYLFVLGADTYPSPSLSTPLPSRANIVVQCENWWNLAKQFASRSPPLHLLSSSVQRTLMKALVLGGFAHMDSDTKQQYWTEVHTHTQDRKSVV